MKIEELRFGNLVFLDNPESWKELQNIPMKVVGIGRNPTPLDGINETITVEKLYPNKYDIYKDYSQFAQYIKPIQLTEEWMLSFGAEKRSDKRVYLENIIKYGFGENPITKDWILLIKYFKDDNIYFFQNGFHKLEYVHQLQNLYFALTNSELICQ